MTENYRPRMSKINAVIQGDHDAIDRICNARDLCNTDWRLGWKGNRKELTMERDVR